MHTQAITFDLGGVSDAQFYAPDAPCRYVYTADAAITMDVHNTDQIVEYTFPEHLRMTGQDRDQQHGSAADIPHNAEDLDVHVCTASSTAETPHSLNRESQRARIESSE